ncbi:hypothetical protein ACFWIK_00870 [Streptomyces anthocyanicus]|uniref:hypothetical protein n=1 Tax=Streptomyces anthocyanicus TaxID=68174 RepID=UPI003666C431
MTRRLNTFVHVDGVAYGPDSKVPASVAKRIGDHAWQDDDAPETPAAPVEAPPRSGRGSGIDAWRAFAEQNGVGVDSDMSREDIIAAAEDAGAVDREV